MQRVVSYPILLSLCSTSLVAQSPAPFDTTLVGQWPYSAMHTLFEKTIFKVDVLTLDVRFGPEPARRLEALAAGRPYSSTLADSIAAVAVDARDAWARLRFERNVSLVRFLDGIRKNLKSALQAGIIDADSYDDISRDLPVWYQFLAADGIHDGDEMFYRIRGDTLHTAYRAVTGEVLLDQIDIGPERRLSVLGGYFAPKSDFRKGLVKSLFEN